MDKLFLINEYTNNRKSIQTISEENGVSYSSVRNKIIKFGIARRKGSETNYGKSIFPELNNLQWIQKKYIEEKLAAKQIAKIIGCSYDAVKLSIQRFKLTKSRSQLILEAYQRNPHKSKFALFNDKDWLFQKSCAEKLTYQQIADLAGAKSTQSIIQHLKKFKIYDYRRPRRGKKGHSSWEQLNDRSWLENMYLVDKKSTTQMADLIGNNCTASSVLKALERHQISSRTKSQGQREYYGNQGLIFNDYTMGIITGGLLGDASLTKTTDAGGTSYSKVSICKEYLIYELERLSNGFIKNGGNLISSRKGGFCSFRGKAYKTQESYWFRTYSYPELSAIYSSWYRGAYNKKTKIIPSDIILTKETLLHWFIDDGYSYVVQRKYSNPKWNHSQIRIYFCTQSFQLQELELLCEKIKKQFDLTLKPRYHKRKTSNGSGYELELSLKDVDRFYSIIGACPIEYFDYKWKKVEQNRLLETQWEEAYNLLLVFIEKNNRYPKYFATKRDAYCPDKMEKRIGEWYIEQRRKYKTNDLSECQIKKIEALSGWVW